MTLLNDQDSPVKNVLILVLNPILREQFSRSFKDQLIHKRITVTADPKELLYKQNRFQLVLIDEGDKFVKEHGVVFTDHANKKQLGGLFLLKDLSFIMLSATFTEMEKKVMKTVMGCRNDSQWIKLPDLLEILTNSPQETKLIMRTCEGKNTPDKVLKELIKSKKKIPILIFAELVNADIEGKIREIATSLKLNFDVVKNIDTLRTIIFDAGLIEDGIFLISIEFSRGIDIKLA